jgi:hypothetical protein
VHATLPRYLIENRLVCPVEERGATYEGQAQEYAAEQAVKGGEVRNIPRALPKVRGSGVAVIR